MRRHRVTTAPPFDGKPTWHALYYDGKHWREVRNQQGGIIAYQTAVAAMIQAKRHADEVAQTIGRK